MNTLFTPEQEATLPTTSPERLRELAYKNDALALLVAQNPNALPKLLRELADKYAKQIWCDKYWHDEYDDFPIP